MPAFLLRMRRQHVALLFINKVGGSRRGLSIRLSGIFTYPACFWNQGVRIIEVLLYSFVYLCFDQKMAFVFRTIRLVPTAIRVTVAGGVTYGTVKAGAWSDSSDSREKLDKVQESISNLREIEYPPMEHIQSVRTLTSHTHTPTYTHKHAHAHPHITHAHTPPYMHTHKHRYVHTCTPPHTPSHTHKHTMFIPSLHYRPTPRLIDWRPIRLRWVLFAPPSHNRGTVPSKVLVRPPSGTRVQRSRAASNL